MSRVLGSPALTPSAATPEPPKKPRKPFRDFEDAAATRSLIWDKSLEAAMNAEPVSNQRHTLRLADVHYADPDTFSLAEQKKALLEGRTLARRLRGTWQLVDNATGGVLDESKQTVAHIPYFTHRGTFIHGGSEISLINQQRLRPGVFTRVKQNGELESHANILPGKGPSHRYQLDPEKGTFYLNHEQAKIPLMPLLRAMGASNKQLQEAWGPKIVAANMEQDTPTALHKLIHKFVRRVPPGAGDPEKTQALLDVFQRMELDPHVSQRTLGKPHKNMSLETILDTTKKLLAVSRGEADVDDRDHLAYQTIHGPEDLISERLQRDYGGLRRKLLTRASFLGNLSKIPVNALGKQVEAALLHSGLGQHLEEINPADVFDKLTRVSRLGEGGIPSLDAVPDEARSVQPSHYGYMDPLRTPECYDEQSEVMTWEGWKPWPIVTEDTRFACLVNGRLEYHTPTQLISQDYDGVLLGGRTKRLNYLVTPNHRMYTRPYCLPRECPEWRIELAETMEDKNRRLRCGGHLPFVGTARESFELPVVEKLSNNTKEFPAIDFDDWAEFMGWYLAEGHTTCDEARGQYTTGISQSKRANPENCELIEELLNRLPFAWSYNDSMKCYIVSGKQLAVYLAQFGFCDDKWIPEEFLAGSISSRQRLFDALLRGDGRANKQGDINQFCSTSRALATDFQRLAFSLGWSCKLALEPDNRQERFLDNHVVHLHASDERVLIRANGNYYRQNYRGKVYCAEVPGGLLYVRREGRCGFWCGNSFKVGVDIQIARGAKKGEDGRLHTTFLDPKTGKSVVRTPDEVADMAVAFPREFQRPGKRAYAIQGGRIRLVPKSEIDLVLPHFDHAMSPLSNMIPLKSATKGQRTAMGSRMLTQAVPLVDAEAPLVQSGIPESVQEPGHATRSYEEEYGKHMGALRFDGDGPARVLSVDSDSMVVQTADGRKQDLPLYNNFPYNRKTFIHQMPVVRAGDVVQPGQLLARSNYTDPTGVTALGKNARVAYIPFRGLNYKDASVISESFAAKMSSEHMYQHGLEWSDEHKRGKRSYVGLFPSKFNREQLKTIDDRGYVQPGTMVKQGDPLILAAQQRAEGYNRIHKKGSKGFADAAVTWEHEQPGQVTDVVEGKHGPVVVVKSVFPAQVGDKLSGRFGDKGVIADIVPDDQMPHDGEGRPFEILVNPAGIISRTNPSQAIEAWLGKAAAARGQPYKVPDFEDIEDLTSFAMGELQKHGLQAREAVYDPETGRKIAGDDGKGVLTGVRHYMKLHHMAESKGQGRGLGGYTQQGEPAKGGEAGSKRLALMDTNALLSLGATQVLRDASLIRGQRNEDYWMQFMQGHNPPEPDVPFVYKKFVNDLKASGINVVPDGSKLHIMALTNRDVDTMVGNRQIKNSQTVHWDKRLKPVEGGLFDPSLTGGHNGNRWSYIALPEPMPNPVMEEPIRRILGLTQQKMEDIIAGTEPLGDYGTGPGAIQKALANINLPKAIETARAQIKGGRATIRDDAARRLKYLKAAETMGLKPEDWMLSKVPVLPPIFRPISVISENQMPLVSDANYLYKELLDATENFTNMKKQVTDVGDERRAVYQSFKAVTGLGDPVHPKLQEKKVSGILKHIFGSSPKFGTVQRRLLSSAVDLVGRATITPNPDLDMDHVGLPEPKAWDLYKVFVVRRLKRRGLPLSEAVQQVKNQTPQARQELLKELEERPVYIDRAPVLHRYGVMAFWPQLTKSHTLQVSPMICKGFNADFDGDAMNYHVPVGKDAVNEAVERMMPSANLISPSDFKTPVHYAEEDYVAALYAATRAPKGKPKAQFRSRQDAVRAYLRGEININTPITIYG